MGSRKTRSGSQAALIWGAGFFVAFQGGLALLMAFGEPELRDPLFGQKLDQLQCRISEAGDDAPLIVMLGSSRTLNGLDARLVETELAATARKAVVYNFGIPGAGPLTELIYLRRLLARGIRPDMLLIEVLPPFLSAQVAPLDLQFFPSRRLFRSELPLVARYTGDASGRLSRDWWLGRLCPWHTHRLALVHLSVPRLNPPELGNVFYIANADGGGFDRLSPQSILPGASQRALAHAREEYAYLLADLRLGGAGCQALEELLITCRRYEIPSALVLMPEGDEFRGWYSPRSWSQIETFVADLSSRYASPVIDARCWATESEFLDSHHLLASGAARFSQRLARSIPPPAVRTVGREGALRQ